MGGPRGTGTEAGALCEGSSQHGGVVMMSIVAGRPGPPTRRPAPQTSNRRNAVSELRVNSAICRDAALLQGQAA